MEDQSKSKSCNNPCSPCQSFSEIGEQQNCQQSDCLTNARRTSFEKRLKKIADNYQTYASQLVKQCCCVKDTKKRPTFRCEPIQTVLNDIDEFEKVHLKNKHLPAHSKQGTRNRNANKVVFKDSLDYLGSTKKGRKSISPLHQKRGNGLQEKASSPAQGYKLSKEKSGKLGSREGRGSSQGKSMSRQRKESEESLEEIKEHEKLQRNRECIESMIRQSQYESKVIKKEQLMIWEAMEYFQQSEKSRIENGFRKIQEILVQQEEGGGGEINNQDHMVLPVCRERALFIQKSDTTYTMLPSQATPMRE
ncbi:hypothetical protein WDU94_012460 [Cyamophila willieti]